jgi:protoporphyrinogen oxidase
VTVRRQLLNDSPARRVAVVGSGIAGLTAALRLSKRGYQVTIYEAKEIIGGNLASEKVNDVYHDVYPHMFCDWYVNFWEIFEKDLGLDRKAHFEPRSGVKFFSKDRRNYLEWKNPTTLSAVWADLRSGLLPLPDSFLAGFSILDLAGQPFDRSELLSRISVNGFLHSRPYATERSAELLDLFLIAIWSITANLTSATSYKFFAKHAFTFPHDTPFAWLLKGSLEEKLIKPFYDKLISLGCKLRSGDSSEQSEEQAGRVTRVRIQSGKVRISTTPFDEKEMLLDKIADNWARARSPEDYSKVAEEIKSYGDREGGLDPNARKVHWEEYDYVVLAVPPPALAELVSRGDSGYRIIDSLPHLSELKRLRGEQIAVVDLYFKRKLPGIPKEHVGFMDSDSYLTFLDISQLWIDDPNMRDRTVLILAASDFHALPKEGLNGDGYLMIKQLHDYLPVFDRGERWGDLRSEICWEKSRYQSNDANKLFINEVGSWDWRPRATYQVLPNVFFAGDFCRTDVEMATVEAAVQSGLLAAEALWKHDPLGDPITIAESSTFRSDAVLLAAKFALLPFAYGAKGWSIVLDAVPALAQGDLAQGLLSSGAGILKLPLNYTVDWLETAYGFWKSVLYGRKTPGEGVGSR